MPVFLASHLEEFGRSAFAAVGTPGDIADCVSRSLVLSNLQGHDSHGVMRIPGYIQEVENGTVIPDALPTVQRETATTALLNANWGFGIASARHGMQLAIEKARESQVALVSINRCNHIGRLGEHAEMAAREGMIGLVLCGILMFDGSKGVVAPYGGAGGSLGTNPISFAVPIEGEAPLIVDFATSVIAEGKLYVARSSQQPVVPGAFLDKDGNPSTDPNAYFDGGVLLPFGGYKGYGLSIIIDLLGAQLSSSDSFGGRRASFGTFILAARVDAFRPLAEFGVAAARRLQEIKDVRPARGVDRVRLPGDRERQRVRQRTDAGIPLPEETCLRLGEIAERLQIQMPRPLSNGTG